jgi:hypothetical protein
MDKTAVCVTDSQPVPPPLAASVAASFAAGVAVPPDPPINDVTANRSCSVGGVYQPELSTSHFLGFSAFSYVWQFFNVSLTQGSPKALAESAVPWCALSWAEAQARNPGNPYIGDYCAQAAFIHALLVDGYGFANDTTQIQVADPSLNIGWALGSMFFDANSEQFTLFANASRPPLEIAAIALGITTALFAAFAAGLGFLVCRAGACPCSNVPTSRRTTYALAASDDVTNPLNVEESAHSP